MFCQTKSFKRSVYDQVFEMNKVEDIFEECMWSVKICSYHIVLEKAALQK